MSSVLQANLRDKGHFVLVYIVNFDLFLRNLFNFYIFSVYQYDFSKLHMQENKQENIFYVNQESDLVDFTISRDFYLFSRVFLNMLILGRLRKGVESPAEARNRVKQTQIYVKNTRCGKVDQVPRIYMNGVVKALSSFVHHNVLEKILLKNFIIVFFFFLIQEQIDKKED